MNLQRARWSAIRTELREILVEMARAEQLVTYAEVCVMMHTVHLHYHSPALTRLLAEIGAEEARAGRPMLPALVVTRQTGMPGAGFFKDEHMETIADPRAWWQEQVRQVFEYWSDSTA